jgi:hypothetical protein
VVPPERLFEELLAVARAVGLEVRSLALRGSGSSAGGLCTIKGQVVVILDSRKSAIDRTTTLADALSGRDLINVTMPYQVRGFIEARTRTRSRLLLPQRRPGPGLAACGTRRKPSDRDPG